MSYKYASFQQHHQTSLTPPPPPTNPSTPPPMLYKTPLNIESNPFTLTVENESDFMQIVSQQKPRRKSTVKAPEIGEEEPEV